MNTPRSPLRKTATVPTIPTLIHKLTQLLSDNQSLHSESWRNDAEKLLTGLKRISKELINPRDQEILPLCIDINNAITPKSRDIFKGLFPGTSERSSNKADQDLKSLVARLESIITRSLERRRPSSPNRDSTRLEDRVIGALSGRDFPVVSVWGKSGMGKTTLANKVFHDDQIRRDFQGFVWVPVNQDFQTKPVLQVVLMQLLPSDRKGEIRVMDEIELSQQVFKALKEKKSLVVLEDIRDVEDWKSIRVAFPSDKTAGTKVLITTSSYEVARNAGKDFSMNSLNEEECSKILKEEADFEKSELETVGKTIYKLSGGCPLIVIILGKSLKTTDVDARNKLLQDLSRFQFSEVEERKVLELCYDRLSPELKPCLLYMGLFPDGQDIDVEKLSLLLAAEDLIPPENSVGNMLQQLALKSLVEVHEDQVSITGMYKSCRLHDQIRNFCISQGHEEDFFEIADVKDQKYTIRQLTSRLAVYLNKSEDGNIVNITFDTTKKIRSLLVFDTHESDDKSAWPSEINDRKEFAHLRVLGFVGVDFIVRKLPRRIDKLVFLRYLSFQGCWLEALPSSISSLTMLETLDLRVTTDCKMTIPNNVLSNMKKLRHLYFPQLYESDVKHHKLRLKNLEKLETLVNFDTDVCEVKNLLDLTNLKILAIISQGKKEDLNAIMECLDGKTAINLQNSSLDIRNFDCYCRDATKTMEKLLTCTCLRSLHIEGQIGDVFPKNVLISPSFTEMEFNGSELEDDLINALGKAENLRSLVLSNDAFVGNKMSFFDESKSRKLRIMKFMNLQYLEELIFEGGAIMPELSTLVIDKCDYLKIVQMPKELDDRLQNAQRKKGDYAYSVEPTPTITHAN